MLKSDMPNKVLPYKTYNSIGHLSGSRLGISDSHIDAKQDSFMTKKFPDYQKLVLYIEEKMDGTNVCVVRFEDNLRVLSRSGYDCQDSPQEQHRIFYRYVQKNIEKFQKLLPDEHDRVVGEWTALAHGTLYAPIMHPFHVFDIFKNKVEMSVAHRTSLVAAVGLNNVPVVYSGKEPVSIENALSLIPEDSEGVIYRLEKIKKGSNTWEDNIPWIKAKVVCLGKEDGKYLRSEKPVWNWFEE